MRDLQALVMKVVDELVVFLKQPRVLSEVHQCGVSSLEALGYSHEQAHSLYRPIFWYLTQGPFKIRHCSWSPELKPSREEYVLLRGIDRPRVSVLVSGILEKYGDTLQARISQS